MSKIESVITGLGESGGTIRIHRKGPADTAYAFVTKISADSFDIEGVKKIYGGGDYRCQTFRSNGQLYKSFDFSIDARFKGALDDQQIGALAKSGGQSTDVASLLALAKSMQPAQTDNGMVTMLPVLLKMMETSQAQSQQTMMLMMQMQQNQSGQFLGLVTALAPVLPALFKRDPLPDHMPTMVELMKTALAPKPGGSMHETIEALVAMKSLVSDNGGDQKALWERVLTAVAPSFGPLASAIFQKPVNLNVAVPGAVGGSSEAPAALPPDGTGALPAPPPQPQSESAIFLQRMLLNGAEKDGDPQSYADLVADSLDPASFSALQALLTRDDWRATVFDNDEATLLKLRDHTEWFDDLRQLLLNYERPTDQPETGPADEASGERGDARPDGAVSGQPS